MAGSSLKADAIIVEKSKRRLLLMYRGELVKSYRVCRSDAHRSGPRPNRVMAKHQKDDTLLTLAIHKASFILRCTFLARTMRRAKGTACRLAATA